MPKGLLQKKPVRFVLEMAELYFSKHISRSAAELAYFLILSFFPLLICVNAFISLLPVDLDAVLEASAPLLPPAILSILKEYVWYITSNQSTGLLIAGLFMTLFSASAAFRALMNIMEEIYGRKGYRGFRQILASVLFAVLLLVTICLSLVVLLTGGWLFQTVERLLQLETHTLPWDWQWFRFLLLFLLVFLFVLLVYRVAAPAGRPRPPVLTGAFLASVALSAFSILWGWMLMGRQTGEDYNALILQARREGRAAVTLTCREHKVAYYESFGFKNLGVAASVHGGVTWYDMYLPLTEETPVR